MAAVESVWAGRLLRSTAPRCSFAPGVQGASDICGRSTALTIFTGVPRWWAVWLRANWKRVARKEARAARHGRTAPSEWQQTLIDLSFVSFAHWAAFDRVPPGGEAAAKHLSRPYPTQRLKHPYLLFQTNFNGDPRQYFEAFSRTINLQMRALWQWAYGVPPPLPAGPFADYILSNRLPNDHYYCAYPDSSTNMVFRGTELVRRLEAFTREAAGLEPEAFAERYQRFIADVQELL